MPWESVTSRRWESTEGRGRWKSVEPSPAREAMLPEEVEPPMLPRKKLAKMEPFEAPTFVGALPSEEEAPVIARGIGEAALAVAGGFIDLPYIGWRTMAELARGASLDDAMKAAEESGWKPSLGLRAIAGVVSREPPEVTRQGAYWRVKEGYIPESEEGREVLEMVGKGFELIRDAALVVGEQVPEPRPIINIDPDAQKLIHDIAKTLVASGAEGTFYVLMGMIGRGALRKPRITRANIVEARSKLPAEKLAKVEEIDRILAKPKEPVEQVGPLEMEEPTPKPIPRKTTLEKILEEPEVEEPIIDLVDVVKPEVEMIRTPEALDRYVEKLKVAKPAPKAITTQINKEMPGNDLKYDGEWQIAPDQPIKHQFTPQVGVAKGATFLVDELDIGSVRSKLATKIGQFGKREPTPEIKADIARETSIRTITMEEVELEAKNIVGKSKDLNEAYEGLQELVSRYEENPEIRFNSATELMEYRDWGEEIIGKVNLARKKAGLEEIPERKGPLRSVTKEGEEILFEDPTDAGGFATREAAEIYRRVMKIEGEVIENPNMPGQFVITRPVTLEFGGMQNIYEAVANKLSKTFRRKEGVTTTEAIRRRDKQRWFTTPEELAKIRAIARERGVSAEDLDAIAKNVFEKKHVMLLDREEVELIKLSLLERERTPLLESFRIVQDTEGIAPRAKKRLERRIKVYDVDDIELRDLISLYKEGETLTTKEVHAISRAIYLQNELRPYDSPTFNSIAPIKRILGEKFMAPIRKALVAFYEDSDPFVNRGNAAFRGLNRRSRRAISEYREGLWKEKQLSAEELRASDTLQELYDELWYKFGLDKMMKEGDLVYVKRYSPRRTVTHEDQVNWAFSRRGIKEFDFWAEHRRTGTLWERETDAKALYMSYVRAGHSKIHFTKAQEAVGWEKVPGKKTLKIRKGSIIDQLSPDKQAFASKWFDTVIRKRPTADEAAIDPLLRSMMRRAGLSVRDNQRVYKSLMSTMLSLNYASYMGLRPKLGIRNLFQQWLVVNEYGLSSYLDGLAGRFTPEVRNAMKNSDVIKLRRRNYAVFEDRVMGMRDIPGSVRDKLMILYRAADMDNVRNSFSTGYRKAKRAGLPEAGRVRAGEKAITNTQWGYGVDLPYMFKSPTGKGLGQYSTWFIWYTDHLSRMIIERQGAKAARTAIQGAILYYLADKYGVDYTRTFLLGVVPKKLGGALGTTIMNVARLLNAIGAGDPTLIKSTAIKAAEEAIGAEVPGYLLGKDIIRAIENERPEELLFYLKPEEQRERKEEAAGFSDLGTF